MDLRQNIVYADSHGEAGLSAGLRINSSDPEEY